MKRILLIHPPASYFAPDEKRYSSPPVGLLYLAGWLGEAYEVGVLDAQVDGAETVAREGFRLRRYGLTHAEIRDRIREFSPHLVGVTNLFSCQARNALDVCRLAKEVDPAITTVLGGAHPGSLPEDSLEHPSVDYVVIGEGERPFKRLCDSLLGKGSFPAEDSRSLAWRENGRVKVDRGPDRIEDLDTTRAAWERIDLPKYFRLNSAHGFNLHTRYAPLITSRGCPYRCTFCASPTLWGGYRNRSWRHVLAEIEHLTGVYGVKEIHFEDDHLLWNRDNAMALFQGMIDRKLNLRWAAPNGVGLVDLDDELLRMMKASGCYYLSVPVESGSERVLRQLMRKPHRLVDVEKAVERIKAAGIESHAFLMIGFPGETREEIEMTVRFARRLRLTNCRFFIVAPLPGSALWRDAWHNGHGSGEHPDWLDGLRYSGSSHGPPGLPRAYLRKVRHQAWLLTTFWDRGLYLSYAIHGFVLPPLRFLRDALSWGAHLVRSVFAPPVQKVSAPVREGFVNP